MERKGRRREQHSYPSWRNHKGLHFAKKYWIQGDNKAGLIFFHLISSGMDEYITTAPSKISDRPVANSMHPRLDSRINHGISPSLNLGFMKYETTTSSTSITILMVVCPSFQVYSQPLDETSHSQHHTKYIRKVCLTCGQGFQSRVRMVRYILKNNKIIYKLNLFMLAFVQDR